MPYGLKAETLDSIRAALSAHPGVVRAVLYGSRAKGNFRDGSDIDLCLIAPTLSLAEQLQIETELDDLLLPYKIDLSRFHVLDNPALIEHIQRVGVTFYEAKSPAHPRF